MPSRACEVDAADLSGDEQAGITSLLALADKHGAPSYAVRPGADHYSYAIKVTDGPDSRMIEVDDRIVPEEAWPLIEKLQGEASPE